jgi:cyclopropane-fatty-acyl-phospholipid synthase
MTLTMAQDVYLDQARKLAEELLELLPARPFAVRFVDGSVIPPKPADQLPSFTLVLKHPAALRRMFIPPSELAMGESYIFDDYDIEGDIATAFDFVDQLQWPELSFSELLSIAWRLWRLERAGRNDLAPRQDPSGRLAPYEAEGVRHSADRDERSIQFHYDVSNDFYKLFLDRSLQYSCAYYADPEEDLDTAQLRKIDLICRKLHLHPGERFLDIGCGWGALPIHAAQNYEVRSMGITLSAAQAQEANARISKAGLSDLCHVSICHYDKFEADEPVDKLASIGMVEHVGREKLANYFQKMYGFLRPGGLFLLQVAVGRLDRRHAGQGWMERLGMGRTAFAAKYTFPDTRLLDIPTVLQVSEQAGFETRDVESLREHYPRTFSQWLERLEQNHLEAIEEVGEVTYRVWRILFASYIHMLNRGYLADYQVLLSKPTKSGATQLPLMRSV